MMIKVQCQDRRWRVIDPTRPEPIAFASGAVAFDYADTRAREHHARTGDASAVRVESPGAYVDAAHYG